MQEFTEIIKRSELMNGIEPDEIPKMLSCIQSTVKQYKKSNIILAEGSIAEWPGMVLDGEVSIVKTDFYGNKNIILALKPSDLFAESVVFSNDNVLPFSVEAVSDCKILTFNKSCMTKTCCSNCGFHIRLIKNLLTALANRNVQLTRKMAIMTLRTTREKILELLAFEAKKQRNKSVTLNMTRYEMADYLSVDRSALSRELSALKSEGIIDYYLNTFKLP